MTEIAAMAKDAELIVPELEQIAQWERERNVDALLQCAIVKGGVLERESCEGLRRLGQPSYEACLKVMRSDEQDPFFRFSAARILGVISGEAEGRILAEFLTHPELAVRRGAAEGLGYHRNPETVDALIALLAEEDAPLRRSATFALMFIGEQRAAPALLPLLQDRNPNVRRAAAVAISVLDGATFVTELAQSSKDEDRSVRRAVVQALARIRHPAAAGPLLQLARDEAVDVRHEAVNALGHFVEEEPRAIDQLIASLTDRSNQVRRSAVNALSQHKVLRAVKPLCDLLRDGPERLSQIEAARALGNLGDPYAVERLAYALLVEDFNLQEVAQQALNQILGEVDLDALRARANVTLERWNLVRTMGASAIPPLIQAIQAQDRTAMGSRIRAAAARTLGLIGRLGHPEVVPPLLQLLDEKIPVVRGAAAEALATVGDPAAAAKIVGLLDDGNPQLRKAAVCALGTLGNPAMVDRLLQIAQQDPDLDIRHAAVEALGHMHEAAVPALRELLRGMYSREIRLAACRSISVLGTVQAIDLLITALGDADSAIRYTANKALLSYGWAPIGFRNRRTDVGYARWTLREEWTLAPDRVDQVAVLIAALEELDPQRRRIAAEALGDLGDHRAREPLRLLLRDPDIDVAIVAAQSLVALGEEPQDDDDWLPYWVALGDEPRIRQAGARALPALRSELRLQDPDLRREVVRLLGVLALQDVAGMLLATLDDLYPEVVAMALTGLQQLGEAQVRAYCRALPEEESRELAQVLLVLVLKENPAIRQWGYLALGELQLPDLNQVFFAGLDDRHPPVVIECIRVLARHRAEDVFARLTAFLVRASLNEVRIALLEALASLEDRQAVEPLAAWLVFPDEELQAAAREALRRLLGADYREPELIALARVNQERWEEVVRLGTPSLEALAAVLHDHEQTPYQTMLRYHAAVAAGRIGGERARDLLLAELHDPLPRVRAGVLTGLGEVGDRSVFDAIRPFLGDLDSQVREATIRTIGKLRLSEAADEVGQLYHDEDPRVRSAVVEVLGVLDRPAIFPIVEILEGGDSASKRKAAHALAQIGDPASIRYLEFALGDSDYHVRQAARDAMLRLGWTPIGINRHAVDEKPMRWANRDEWIAAEEQLSQVEAMRRGLHAESPLQRRVAAEALGMLGDRDSIPLLTSVAEDPDPDTRMVACQALVTLGVEPEVTPFWAPFWAISGQWQHCIRLGEPAVDPLLCMLHARVARVRKEAIETLGRIGSPRAVPQLTPLQGDPSPMLRRSTIRALAQIGGPEAAEALLVGFRQEADPTLRLFYLEQANQLGPELFQPILDLGLADPAVLVSSGAEDLVASRQLFG